MKRNTLRYITPLFFFLLLSSFSIAQSRSAVKHLNNGVEFYNKKKYDDAISSFTEAIKSSPDYSEAYNWRGFVYLQKKEYQIALVDFSEALRIKPSFAEAKFNIGTVNYWLQNYDESIKDFSAAIQLGADKKKCYWWIGNTYSAQDDYEQAITSYNEIIREYPNSSDGYRLRGHIHLYKNDLEKALADYTKAVDLSGFAIDYFYRGNVYLQQEQFLSAIDDYSKAIKLKPAEIDFYTARGTAYRKNNQYQLAEKDYSMIVGGFNNAEAFNARALFYTETQQFDLAEKDFTQAIALSPKEAWLYTARGNFYSNQDKFDLAEKDFNAAVQISPTAFIYNQRAIFYKDNGKYDLAINDFKTAMQKDPKGGNAHSNILSSLIRTLQFNEAKDYYRKYQELKLTSLKGTHQQFYIPYLEAATVNIPAGDYVAALNNLEESARSFTNNNPNKSRYVNVLALKGYVLEKLGKLEEARDVFTQALSINTKQPDVLEGLGSVNKRILEVARTDKKPPVIELISPSESRGLQITAAANTKVQLIGKAIDPSGIATVSINGKAIARIEEDGMFVSLVSLGNGANTFKITATDKEGNIASKTFTITGNESVKKEDDIITPVAATETIPTYHAIIIAAKDYNDPSIPDLENPLKDAQELKSILQTHYTFSPKNIETLYNKTREEIMQSLVLKSNTLTENDNLLIFYAGHGIAEKDKFGDVDGYWIPSSAKKGLNASYISADDIKKALKRSNAKHILVVADACFSGAFTRGMSSDASAAIQKQYSVPSRKVMASGNLEPVPDNSKFIYYLKKNLKENKEKYLTAKKLFDGFYEAILNNSDTSPQYAAIKNVGDEGGEFVFIKK